MYSELNLTINNEIINYTNTHNILFHICNEAKIMKNQNIFNNKIVSFTSLIFMLDGYINNYYEKKILSEDFEFYKIYFGPKSNLRLYSVYNAFYAHKLNRDYNHNDMITKVPQYTTYSIQEILRKYNDSYENLQKEIFRVLNILYEESDLNCIKVDNKTIVKTFKLIW